jgi:anti-sigma factor RsiW
MTPDKLFDYLDGKLSPADREELERKLANDSQLLRQLAIARDIHRNMQQSTGGAREVIVPEPDTTGRSGKLGRRIATAAFVLVVLNVALGLAVIAGKNRKTPGLTAQEAAIRQQLAASLGTAGANALPVPSFVEDEIRIPAPHGEWEAVADKVVAAAERCGGSAAKGLTEEASMTVVVDVPSARLTEFRQMILPSAAPVPAATAGGAASPNERTIVQVRIAEVAR